MIRAVILAAGESRRMGEPKLVLPIEGRPLLEIVVRNVLASKIKRILVVLGAEAGRVGAVLAGLPVETTVNPGYRNGMLSSVQWGLERLPPDTRAALILPGDMPGVEPRAIDAVVEAYEGGTRGLVVPVHAGRGGHPLLVDLKYREEIRRLDPGRGLRALLADHPDDVLRLPLDLPGIVADVDTPEDLARARDRRKSS